MHRHKKSRLYKKIDNRAVAKVPVSHRSHSIPSRNAEPLITYNGSVSENTANDTVFFIELTTNADWVGNQNDQILNRKVGSRITSTRESSNEKMNEMGQVQCQSTNTGIVRIKSRHSMGKDRCGLQSIGVADRISATREITRMPDSLGSEENVTVIKGRNQPRSRLQLRNRGIDFQKMDVAISTVKLGFFESIKDDFHRDCVVNDEKSKCGMNEQNGTCKAEEDDKIAVTRHHLNKKDVVTNVMTTRRKSGSVGGSGSMSNTMVNAESVISSGSSSSLLPPPSSASSLHIIKESKGKVEVKVVSQTARDDNEHDNDNDKVDKDDEEDEEDDKTAVHHFKMKDVTANVMTTRRKSGSIGGGGYGSNAMVNAESVISSASASSLLPPPPSSSSSSSLLPPPSLHTKDSNGGQKVKVMSQAGRSEERL